VKLLFLFSIILTFVFASACTKKKNDETKTVSESAKENAASDIQVDDVKPTASQLMIMARSIVDNIQEGTLSDAREYQYNKAIGIYRQLIEHYGETFDGIQAQFNMSKLIEEKIKFFNFKEIKYRQRLAINNMIEFKSILPYLKEYTPAINSYIELHTKKDTYKIRNKEQLRKAYKIIVDGLVQAAKLLSDETNPKIDMYKAAQIYDLIIKDYPNSGYADLALFKIITIYYQMKNWEKVVEYGILMERNYMQSQYYLDVMDKIANSKELMGVKE
jgi:tetratricopeptide (TPR) repeat protein